jgi:hypothetical protein
VAIGLAVAVTAVAADVPAVAAVVADPRGANLAGSFQRLNGAGQRSVVSRPTCGSNKIGYKVSQ